MITTNNTLCNQKDSLETPDKTRGRLGLIFNTVKGLNFPRLYEYLREAADENLIDTFLLVFYIRDCRGGKGERNLGRRGLIWLFLNYPEKFSLVAPLIVKYGRWDDLIRLWPGVLDLTDLNHTRANYCVNIKDEHVLKRLQKFQHSFVNIMAHQLINDRAKMESGKPITICAKWAPTEKNSLDRKYGIVRTLCEVMGITPKNYRKIYITPLRQYLNIVEKYMCQNRWNEIKYSKVPSYAMKRLKKAFIKHTPEQFTAWKNNLQTNQITNKSLYPHELVHKIRIKSSIHIVYENKWNFLENKIIKLGTLQNTLFVCDVSPSMEKWRYDHKKFTFCPMDVAIGLSLIGANSVQEPFRNHILPFHENPTFHVLHNGSFYDKWYNIKHIPWSGSLNLEATFELILSNAKKYNITPKKMPKRLFVISDMDFNKATADSQLTYKNIKINYQKVQSKYAENGYTLPQIIFWNLSGDNTDIPISVTEHKTILISGFFPSIVSKILNGNDLSPFEIIRNTLDIERLKSVRCALTCI